MSRYLLRTTMGRCHCNFHKIIGAKAIAIYGFNDITVFVTNRMRRTQVIGSYVKTASVLREACRRTAECIFIPLFESAAGVVRRR